jgi:hypothetical protein
MKKPLALMFIISTLFGYNLDKLEKLVIEHFTPKNPGFTYSRHLSLGGCCSKMFIYYLRIFTHHSSIIKIVEKRPYLLAPTGLIYSHHLAFGGKIGTIRATFVQKIAFNRTTKFIYASDATGKTFSIAKSDDRIN